MSYLYAKILLRQEPFPPEEVPKVKQRSWREQLQTLPARW
jgi:hypothetical protein